MIVPPPGIAGGWFARIIKSFERAEKRQSREKSIIAYVKGT
jgi:hypothetical protein